jgi:lysophospholipase L1-like esterase
MRMRLRSAAARAAIGPLTAALTIVGCSAGGSSPASSGQDSSRQVAAARRASAVRAALHAGLSRRAFTGTSYYLSLGDSLSQGVQPTPTGENVPTSRGYPDRLAAMVRAELPHLRVVKLGCSGETTATMMHGGICSYPAGSQLNQAIRFLRSHRGRTALITIDIGGNDPNSCVLGAKPTAILPCVFSRIPGIARNVGAIVARLRSAAGPRVPIIGMTYYVPELGLWRTGQNGRRLAILTGAVAAGANQMLADGYHNHGARVANVFKAFRTSDFGAQAKGNASQAGSAAQVRGAGGKAQPAGSGPVPPNVAAICSLTWMCAQAPRGPNEHANDAGYRVIARAFWRAIAGQP